LFESPENHVGDADLPPAKIFQETPATKCSLSSTACKWPVYSGNPGIQIQPRGKRLEKA